MTASEKVLHIDIPVKLTDVKAVFSIAALAFKGDLPASIFHIQLFQNDIASWNNKSDIVAVFTPTPATCPCMIVLTMLTAVIAEFLSRLAAFACALGLTSATVLISTKSTEA
jgi:hypothetical protein